MTTEAVEALKEQLIQGIQALVRRVALEAVTEVLGPIEPEPKPKPEPKPEPEDLASVEPRLGLDGRWEVRVGGKTYRATRKRDLNRYMR